MTEALALAGWPEAGKKAAKSGFSVMGSVQLTKKGGTLPLQVRPSEQNYNRLSARRTVAEFAQTVFGHFEIKIFPYEQKAIFISARKTDAFKSWRYAWNWLIHSA